MNLLKNTKFTVMNRGDTGLAATDIDSTVVLDMEGYDGVAFVTSIVEVTAGASTTCAKLAPRHATSNNATSLTELGSTSHAGTATVSTGDVQKALVVDVYRPTQRYMGVSLNKTGAGTSQCGPIIAIQYKGKKAPVTQSTTYVLSSKQCVSPST